MLASKLQTIRLLNGLRLIHTERINGYNKVIAFTGRDPEAALQNINLELLLSNFVRDSIFFSTTLENIVLIEGGKMPYGTKVDQQLYRIIRELQQVFARIDDHSVLACCNACEDAVQAAYSFVLQETGLAADPKDILQAQQDELKKAQAFVKQLKTELKVPASVVPKGVVVELYNQPSFNQGLKLGS